MGKSVDFGELNKLPPEGVGTAFHRVQKKTNRLLNNIIVVVVVVVVIDVVVVIVIE